MVFHSYNLWRQWILNLTVTKTRKWLHQFSKNTTETTKTTWHWMILKIWTTMWNKIWTLKPWDWCWRKQTATKMAKSVLKISMQLWPRTYIDPHPNIIQSTYYIIIIPADIWRKLSPGGFRNNSARRRPLWKLWWILVVIYFGLSLLVDISISSMRITYFFFLPHWFCE